MKQVSHNPDETAAIAADLATNVMAKMPYASHALVLALVGELGTGKTAFTQAFAKALGITEELKSPTFTLMHNYTVPGSDLMLWHLDCYRLQDRRDLANLDLASVFADPRNIVLIEWPDKARTIFPKEHVSVHFTHEGREKRGITVKWPDSLR